MSRPPAKAMRVADHLRVKITSGEYAPGALLPPQRVVADELGVERGTVGRGLHMLAAEGLVEMIDGGHARVVDRTLTRLATTDLTHGDGQWQGFAAAVIRLGGEPWTDVVSVGEVDAPTLAARWLGVPVGTRVLRRERVHGVMEGGERQPAEVATTWITMDAAERVPAVRDVDTGAGGITRRFAEAGYTLQYEDVASARLPSAAEQERLGVGPDSPLLDVWRRSYDQDDRVVKASNRVTDPLRQQLVYRF